MEIHHILVPTDFSAPSQQALTYACELAQKVGAKLSLLHGIEVPVYAIEVSLPLQDLEQDARRGLARLLPEAAAAHVDATRLVARHAAHHAEELTPGTPLCGQDPGHDLEPEIHRLPREAGVERLARAEAPGQVEP
jgi:nucleotide-binding universal stress UspA family protein